MAMSVLRNGVAVVLALATTFGLFALMYALIAFDARPAQETDERKLASIFMPERKIETRFEEVKPEKIEVAATPPEMPQLEFDRPDLNPDPLNMSAPLARPNLDVKGVGGFGSDGEYLPIVKIQPRYPNWALSRGIEGYVIVEFTVTANGSVRDPVIVEQEPENVFNNAAIKAVLKFKYKPRVIDGEPVEVSGVRNKITFKIAD